MQGAEFLICIWGEQQVVLAAALAITSDGGLGQREVSGAARSTYCSPSKC